MAKGIKTCSREHGTPNKVMTREEKIKFLQDVKNGMPLKFALNVGNYRALQRNKGEDIYYAIDGEKITEAERLKYFPDAVIYENVSKQFRIGDGGVVYKI
jgi:hypothetical protein